MGWEQDYEQTHLLKKLSKNPLISEMSSNYGDIFGYISTMLDSFLHHQWQLTIYCNTGSNPKNFHFGAGNLKKDDRWTEKTPKEGRLTVSHNLTTRSFGDMEIVRPSCEVGHIERHIELQLSDSTISQIHI